jgi:hypothetical protein
MRFRGLLLALAILLVAVPGGAVPLTGTGAATGNVLPPSFVAIAAGTVLAARGVAFDRLG